ncbi:MAG TPA: helix-turn-helix domain-containing protein, partial [Nocardioides sp.]|nr:helix-turn-helix domain-containing protein [Nocardioides sp.]
MASTGALERLRAGNQRAVLSLLAGEGPMSRADLVRASGLSRTTVSSLVAELIGAGQVIETDDRARPHKG